MAVKAVYVQSNVGKGADVNELFEYYLAEAALCGR